MKTPREILDENSLTGKLYCHNYEGDERDYEDIIEAMQAYADQQVNKKLDEAIDEFLDIKTATEGIHPRKFSYADCKEILESLKIKHP